MHEHKDYSPNSPNLDKSIKSIYITPLGWSYGVREEQRINLTLGEALAAVNHREQTIPVDGIYSILGLLPYGDKVKVNYKPFGHQYTKEELEKAFSDVIKQAIKSGCYDEIFS